MGLGIDNIFVSDNQVRYIDVHTHINPSGMSLSQIIQNMDNEGIDKMVIMNVPADMGETQSVFGIPDAAEQYPSRFIALYGGEAITMLESATTNSCHLKFLKRSRERECRRNFYQTNTDHSC